MTKREFLFSPKAFEQYQEWIVQEKKIAEKIGDLAQECARTPFDGLGKPEPLKGKEYKGYWSRRITDEHRLIYRVTDAFVYISSCKGHYGDK